MKLPIPFRCFYASAVVMLLLVVVPSHAFLDLSTWPPKTKQHVIFDTDLSMDVDDVGALVVLHKFADIGSCDILAVMLDMPQTGAIADIAKCADAINTYYGRPDIPIGIVKHDWGSATIGSMYVAGAGKNFPNDIDTSKVPEACLLYRQILAQQPDSSVTVVVTGYPTNLAQLIATPEGYDLASRKIRMVVQMGGQNAVCCGGREGNLDHNPAASKTLVDSFPAPIVFSGFAVGAQTSSGAGFRNASDANPAKYAYSTFNFSRSSWDPCAMLFALAGFGTPVVPYFVVGSNHGYQTINVADGSNQWVDTDVAGKAQAFIAMTGNSNNSDPVLLKVLDSIYALPPAVSTEAGSMPPAAAVHSSPAFFSNGTFTIPGVNHGWLEIFDEAGRTIANATMCRGRAAIACPGAPARRALLYRVTSQGTICASGKVMVR